MRRANSMYVCMYVCMYVSIYVCTSRKKWEKKATFPLVTKYNVVLVLTNRMKTNGNLARSEQHLFFESCTNAVSNTPVCPEEVWSQRRGKAIPNTVQAPQQSLYSYAGRLARPLSLLLSGNDHQPQPQFLDMRQH